MPRVEQPKFQTIVADPPWPYDTSRTGNFAIPKSKGQEHQRAVHHMGYSTLTMEQLAGMKVEEFADTPCHLYLWTTNAFMNEAFDLVTAWGFQQKTILTWGKLVNDTGKIKASMGVGYYYRGSTEHCLFAVRGSQRLLTETPKPTLYMSRRLGHSIKPDWFYRLVEECSPGPRLDVFARKPRAGWSVFGNEVESDVNIHIPGE